MGERLNLRFPQRISAVRVVGGPPGGGEPPPGEQTLAAQVPGEQEVSQQVEVERDRLRTARAALEEGAKKLAESRKKIIGEVEGQLLDLATGIARKVLMQEIQAGRYDIEPIVREALCHVPARQDVVIRLNPEDHAQCEMARQEAESGEAGTIRFVADPSVQPAECVVETSEGVIESSVEAHLENVSEVLKTPE